jgi:type IV pilus assembly protein PilV
MFVRRWAVRSTCSQRGVSLLEVLVAMVVLSIGLIGIAGLQSMALKMNNSAYMRSQATVLAYDMADRVRANADAGTAYNQPTATANANCENNTGCSPQAMASNDMFLWQEQIEDAMLPLGVGTICLDATPDTVACDGAGDTYVVRVTWDDDRDGIADPNNPNENIVVSFSR